MYYENLQGNIFITHDLESTRKSLLYCVEATQPSHNFLDLPEFTVRFSCPTEAQ